jgi:hypothetical protein
MVGRGNLSRQTDNETADEEAGKGERNDFTSREANRHGGGDGRPEGRLNFNQHCAGTRSNKEYTDSQHIGNPVGRETPGSPYPRFHWNGIDILVLRKIHVRYFG